MDALKVILAVIMILLQIVLIGLVLLQPGQKAGLGAISGAAESYFSKGKNKTREAKLALITKVVVIMLLTIVIAGLIWK